MAFEKAFKKTAQGEILLEINAVRRGMQKAVDFLKKQLLSRKNFRQLPWYLVLGEKSSGKTQLILNSGLSFLEQDTFVQITPEGMETQNGINYWISSSGLLIDIPGAYLEETQTLTPARAAWLELLQCLRRYGFGQPLNGIIMVSDLLSLETPEKFSFLKSRLTEIAYQLKQSLPLYWIITKTDKLQGFSEYFDDLGKHEREQCCGLTLPLSFQTDAASWVQPFTQAFELFTTQLHQRALWRMHQEQALTKRQRILNFPHQIENLKASLQKIIHLLNPLQSHLFLRGIYFTSSVQQKNNINNTNNIDYIEKTLEKNLDLLALSREDTDTRKQNLSVFQHSAHRYHFFITHLFQQKIFPEASFAKKLSRKKTSSWESILKWVSVGLSGLVLITAVTFFSRSYHQQTRLLNTTNTALADYRVLALSYDLQHKQAPDIEKLLPALNALGLAAQSAEQANLPWLLRFQLHHKQSLSEKINRLYLTYLIQTFIPALQAEIGQQLMAQDMTNTTQLYGLLKAYLMLQSPQHFDAVFLKYWFYHDFQNPLMQNTDFKKQLDRLLNPAHQTRIKLILNNNINNPNLINQARDALNALPYILLSSAIFNHQTPQHLPLVLNLTNASHSFSLSAQNLPPLFTQPDPEKISLQVNQAVNDAVKGNWVLGPKTGPGLSLRQLTDLQRTLITQNQQVYNTAWQKFLSQLKLNPASLSSLSQLDLSLQELSSLNSPLTQILHFIQRNNSHNPEFEKYAHFPLKDVLSGLHKLDTQIVHPVLNSRNTGASALLMAQHLAQQTPQRILFDQLYALYQPLPAPFRQWLLKLTDQTRLLVFEQGLQYTSDLWQKTVLPLCQKEIDNRYPFSISAQKDVSLKNFSRFFEKDGIFDQFLTLYLAPFIDTSHPKWQWKDISGTRFSSNTDFLSQFERANIIQAVYFNAHNQLSMPFSLFSKNILKHYNWPLEMPAVLNISENIISNTPDHLQDNWRIFKLADKNKIKIKTAQISPLAIKNITRQFKCPSDL